MVKIIVATMVKDEDDIIEEWIKHYSKIFGYENLFIIDNYSSDNTFEICQKYLIHGLHLERQDNYKLKGDYMTRIKNENPCDFFIPVDIDEFITLYNEKDGLKCDGIIQYFEYLMQNHSRNLLFKMNYIMPTRTNNDLPILKQFTHGSILDYGSAAKTFIQSSINNNIKFDHGNHFHTNDYILSDLYLIHYHQRSDAQHKKKIINNVLGLGYEMNIDYLKSLHKECSGFHHVNMCIHMLEHPESDNSPFLYNIEHIQNQISLNNFINFIYE